MTAVSSARQYIIRLNAMAERFHGRLWLLLWLSGILGAVGGITTATWQQPVETAQVLLGLVTYDHSALPYAYHVSLFSLVNYAASLFLAATHSEAISSILLAAVLGVLAMQTLAMAIFVVVRNVYVATLVAGILTAVHVFGTGICYPIFFLGTEHAYGRAGLMFDIYALLWLAFARYRTGLFFSGLAVGVHPAWGLWLNLILGLVAVIRFRDVRQIVRPVHVLAWVAGVGLPLALFAWQKSHYAVSLPDVVPDFTAARHIFLNYITYWDYHRQKFDNRVWLAAGFSYALVTLVLAATYFTRTRDDTTPGRRLFFLFLIVTTLLSAPLVFIPSWFDPARFPEWFVTLMPGRFIDISIFLCVPLLFATIAAPRGDKILSSLPLQILAILALFIVASIHYGTRDAAALVLLTEGIVILRHTQRFHIGGAVRQLGLPVILLVCLSPIFPLLQHDRIEAAFPRTRIPGPVNGSILTTQDDYMIQLQTRISSITPHIDGYVYLDSAASLIELDQFTTDLFGVPLSRRPPAGSALHRSYFATEDFRRLWEARTCDQWRQLSQQYHFGLIVVPADMPLKLKRLDDDPKWGKYRPVCPP